MSPALDTREIEFVRAIRRALDEHVANLAPATLDRLAAARQSALARKKPVAAPVFQPAFAGAPGQLLAGPRRRSPFGRLALAWPMLALTVSLLAIGCWENHQRTAELADIDAAMLSDDLPLNAYLDHGFNAYLSRAR